MQQVWKFLHSIGGTAVLIGVAIVLGFMYVRYREQVAVERAQWQVRLDSLAAAHRADSTAAALRDSVRTDSIRRWQRLADIARHRADVAAEQVAGFADAVRAAIDSADTAGQAALDSLVTVHRAEVADFRSALAAADSIHKIDSTRVADRDAQLARLRSDLADMTTQATRWERRAHPGLFTQVLRSPWTHAGAFVLGVVLGKKG